MTEGEIRETRAQLGPGAGRKKARLAQTPVMLDPAERLALDTLAGETGRSRSSLIREAVRRVWLKKRPCG